MNIIETNLQFNNLAYGNNPKMIVLHHAEASTCTIQEIHQWHLQNGWAGCGYHFLVRKDGTVYRGRPEDAIGAHCPSENSHSIGICAEGDFRTDIMNNTQKNAIIELCNYIKGKYSITKIGGHKEFYPTECPGINYPLAEIKDRVMNNSGTIVAYNTPVNSDYDIDSVKYLQHELNIQLHAGLVEDNIAGNLTLGACCIIKYGCQGNITRWIQSRLNHLGFNCGQADGIFGNMTLQAVKAFQARYGLVQDGIIGRMTWAKLLGL